MSDSLKDQLRALGLAPKPKQPRHNKTRKHRSQPTKAKRDGSDISLDQAYRLRGKQERQLKEQAIARKRELERQRREINQKIKALIHTHGVRDDAASIKRNFLYKGKIRTVLVTPSQMADINSSQLGVAYLSGNYHLLPVTIIKEVSQISPDHVPDLAGAESAEEQEHPVPDDLTW